MGNTFVPQLVQVEQTSWVKNHTLDKSARYLEGGAMIQDARAMIREFGTQTQARLCGRNLTMTGMTYVHYFITDGSRTIEFGGGEISNNTVEIHNRTLAAGYYVLQIFEFTDEHRNRTEKVLGATNYSLCPPAAAAQRRCGPPPCWPPGRRSG